MSPGAESANWNRSRPASPAVSPSASDTSQGAIWLVGSVGELASAGGWAGRGREGVRVRSPPLVSQGGGWKKIRTDHRWEWESAPGDV